MFSTISARLIGSGNKWALMLKAMSFPNDSSLDKYSQISSNLETTLKNVRLPEETLTRVLSFYLFRFVDAT